MLNAESWVKRRSTIVLLCLVLGFISSSKGQEIANKEYLLKQAAKFESSNDAVQAAYYYNNLAYVYWNKGSFDSSIYYFQKVLSLSKDIGNNNALKVVNTNLGLLYSEKRDDENSQSYFDKALAYARLLQNRSEVVNALINLACSKIETEHYADAEMLLLEANGIATELNSAVLLKNCLFNLNILYERQGNNDKANECFSQYTMLVKQLQDKERIMVKAVIDSAKREVKEVVEQKEQTTLRLNQVSAQLEIKDDSLRKVEILTREQQMQITLLNTEMKLRDAEIERQRLMRHIYIGIAIFSIIIALLLYYAYCSKKQANRELNEKNKEILFQKEEISKQAEKLGELNAMKDKLFSIISHDLRSPLFSLMTLLNFAKDSSIDEVTFKKFIEDISDNVTHTSLMLENLLTWARSQMQGTKVNIVGLSVEDVIAPTLNLLVETARQKHVLIENNIGRSSRVLADADFLSIVIRNLVSNAIKFSNEGDTVRLSYSKAEGVATICVEDSGVGMPNDVLYKLFGNEIKSSLGTKQERGTGLGLIICKEFIEIMHGCIWAESEVGHGSRFYITLPLF